jgi:hypothetical protein
MNRFKVLCFAALPTMVLFLSSAHGGTIAHWSFDQADVTLDANSNIVVANDATTNHNATAVNNGTGTSIKTAAGQFGDAAQFSNLANNAAQSANNSWLSLPQLGEIAGPTGTSFTIGVWVNGPSTLGNNTVLADWGNASSGNRFTYWFDLANVDSNTANPARTVPRPELTQQHRYHRCYRGKGWHRNSAQQLGCQQRAG